MSTISPFDGIQGVTQATNIKRDQKYKIAIIGKGKSGKSWFAATAPGKIMYYDCDDRAQSLIGHKNAENLFIKTVYERVGATPSRMGQIETDLSTFQARKIQGKPIPDTYVFDTMTYLIQIMENETFKANPDLYRTLKIGNGKSFKVGAGWDYYKVNQAYAQYLLSEFSALGNVIFVFHEKDEEDKDKSTKDRKAYTGQITVNPQYMESILTLFNEVFMIEVEGAVVANSAPTYKVTCRPSLTVRASTTLLVDQIEPPDLMAMIKKSEEARTKLGGK